MSYLSWIIVAFDIGPILLTIIGNSAFFITIWKTRSLNTPSNTLLVFLSITDLIVGLTCQPLFIALLFKHEDENSAYLFIAYDFVYSITCINSLLCVSLISLNRFIAVVCPIKYRKFASRRRFTYITLTGFLFSGVISTIGFLPIEYELAIFLVYFVIHSCFLILILATHCGILTVMTRRKRISISLRTNGGHCPRVAYQIQRRTTRTIAWVTLAFLLCSLPYLAFQIQQLLYFIIGTEEIHGLAMIANFFILFHSALNPLIYFVSRRDIRLATWRLLHRNAIRNQTSQSLSG